VDGKMRSRGAKVKSYYHHLVMFDFDETLAHTNEATLVRDKKTQLIVDHLYGQQEHDDYTLDEEKHFLDFSEFFHVSAQATPIPITLNLLKQFLSEENTKVIVLTARQPKALASIQSFLEEQGVNTESVSFFGANGSGNKKGILSDLIRRYSISRKVTVFEDNLNNIKDLIVLEYEHPNISFDLVQVINPSQCDDLEEAKRFTYPKGQNGTEKYQMMLKKIHPMMKRRLLGLGANDYLDTGVKKSKDFKKSKSSPPAG
jgi:hypothetical protein